MRMLLDTHAFLWFVLNDAQLSRAADALISDPTNEVLISPATYWEMAIKVAKTGTGRFFGAGRTRTRHHVSPRRITG